MFDFVAERRLNACYLADETPNWTVSNLTKVNPMANTYTSLHYHIVFSTKNREPWITPEIEERIWAYLGGIATKNRMKPIQIGGVDDHVHVLLGAPRPPWLPQRSRS
jgi:REP element-mobilizing transposase RayT